METTKSPFLPERMRFVDIPFPNILQRQDVVVRRSSQVEEEARLGNHHWHCHK